MPVIIYLRLISTEFQLRSLKGKTVGVEQTEKPSHLSSGALEPFILGQ